jgi:hypothetical protein
LDFADAGVFGGVDLLELLLQRFGLLLAAGGVVGFGRGSRRDNRRFSGRTLAAQRGVGLCGCCMAGVAENVQQEAVQGAARWLSGRE